MVGPGVASREAGLRRKRKLLTAVRLLLSAAVAAVFLASCSHPITDFRFQVGAKRMALHTSLTLAAGTQGQFLPLTSGTASAKGRETPLYSLNRPPSAAPTRNAFYIEYTASAGPLELHLDARQSTRHSDTQTAVPLPILARSTVPVKLLVPVVSGEKIVSFKVTSTSPEADIHIRGVGLTTDVSGITFHNGVLTIRDGVRLTGSLLIDTPSGGGDKTTTLRFASLVDHIGAAQAQIILRYTYNRASGAIRLSVESRAGERQRYLIQPRTGTHQLYLYTASCGFTPDTLTVSTTNNGFSLDSVLVNPFPTPRTTDSFTGTTKPIPADFGTILAYQPKWWRQKEYELFSWNLIPSVLVMEFESYRVQARFMKRFAFFIEKQGYVGKLWTNEQLDGLHGWNAHDYRPEDLARFYATAEKENFTLNPEEIQLRKILLANGVIRLVNNTFEPGQGAILTFAHVGPIWLRSLLLTHEGYHGIFFTHPAYREAVFSIWDSTPIGERDVFRYIFLPYFRYDIGDIYLVKNEFQAYLMEQPLDQTKSYFRDQLATEMRVMKIPSDSPLARYAQAHPDMFYRSAEKVQQAVERAAGVAAGDLVGLLPN